MAQSSLYFVFSITLNSLLWTLCSSRPRVYFCLFCASVEFTWASEVMWQNKLGQSSVALCLLLLSTFSASVAMCLALVAMWGFSFCISPVSPSYVLCLSLVLSFALFFSYQPLFASFVSTDVFSSPMWADLNHVKDPSLRRLVEKLPEVVLGSRADNTTLSYFNSFKRWCAWACKFPEVTVLPATPAYVSLYLLSVL